MCSKGNEAGRRTEMKMGRAGEATGRPSHTWKGKRSAGFWCVSPDEGKGKALCWGAASDQEISGGLGKAMATPTQIEEKHPDIMGLELPVKH